VGPDRHGRGPRQQHPSLQDLALSDRHRRVHPSTQDEESSGIIDASDILGRGWFLLDVQAHKLSADPELVEGGQLLALFVDPRIGDNRRGKRDDEDRDDNGDDE